MRTLVHPRMLSRLGVTHFPDRVTIEVDAPTRSPSGAEVHAWTPLAGHVAIPAAIGPAVDARLAERREGQLTVAETTHRIGLAGAYPSIRADMRAVVATGPHSGIYDVVRPGLDNQGAMTVLEARITSPVAEAGA